MSTEPILLSSVSLALPATKAPDAHRPLRVGAGDEDGDTNSTLSPTKLAHGLRRKWYIAVPLAALVACGVYAAADSRLTPTYTARTLLQVSTKQPILLYDLQSRSEAANHQRTQVVMVKSRFIGQTALRELEPLHLPTVQSRENPVAWLEKELQVDYTMAPDILRISLKGSNPEDLLLIVAAVRDAYLREVLNKDSNDRVAWREKLVELSAKDDVTLKALRKKLTALAEAFGTSDLTGTRVKREYAENQLQALQTELLYYRANVQRAQVAGTGGAGEAPLDTALVETTLDKSFAVDPIAEGIRKEIGNCETQVLDLERHLQNYATNTDYLAKKQALTEARRALSARREELRAAALAQAREALRVQRTRDAETRDRTIAAAKEYIPQLEAEIARRAADVTKLARGVTDLELLQADINQHEERIKAANAKVQALDIELHAPPRARVLEEPVIVDTPKWDRSLKMAGAPAIGAFFGVLLVVAWLDVRRGRVDGVYDLQDSPIRLIGTVPSVRHNVLRMFGPPGQSRSRQQYLELTDALDMARAVIAPSLVSKPVITLVIASATAGEGKTVLAGHLAVRFAKSGRRTLLIDTDVRRPRIHELFGLAPGPGFGDWVAGRVDRGQATTPTVFPGLDVILAGRADPQSVCVALDQRLPDLLNEVRRDYEVIIFDSAPVLIAPESLVLSRAVDGVLLSVMRDVSRMPGVLAAYERLNAVSANILGAVVTGAAAPQGSTGY